MKDVAHEAGVSTATVSHVINGTRQVAADTAAAVNSAIARLGYIHNQSARAMRTGSTRTIGLAISAISNRYFGDIVNAIETRITARGYTIMLSDTHDDPVMEARIVDDLLRHRPAGIILAPSADPSRALAAIGRSRVPHVSVDRVISGVDSVGVENTHAMRTMVQHLIDNGHRSIGFVAGGAGLTTTEERIDGYRQAMTHAGLPCDHLILHTASDPDVAQHDIRQFIAGNSPSALAVGNNLRTVAAMRAIRDLGLSVPHDLAMVVFDDFEWADAFSPRLTAVAQPYDEMARLAVDMLFEQITNNMGRAQSIRIQPTLNHRDSCGCSSPHLPL